MKYEYPLFVADPNLKRLHVHVTAYNRVGLPIAETEEFIKKCDLGDPNNVVDFVEAVRLFSEEAFRTCGNCLMRGGEVSNWKERAERAEADVKGLQSQLVQSDKLAADWKAKDEANYKQLCELREQLGLEKAP